MVQHGEKERCFNKHININSNKNNSNLAMFFDIPRHHISATDSSSSGAIIQKVSLNVKEKLY